MATDSNADATPGSEPSELEALHDALMTSPAARARFLADTAELLERSGVDTGALLGRLDLTNGSAFLGGLAASTLVITRTSTGKGFDPGTAASSVVITRTSTGKGFDPGTAADTIVITRTSTGKGFDPGTAASTLVITRTSTGKGFDPGTAASTLVITRSSTGLLHDLASGLGQIAGLMQREVEAIEEHLAVDDTESAG